MIPERFDLFPEAITPEEMPVCKSCPGHTTVPVKIPLPALWVTSLVVEAATIEVGMCAVARSVAAIIEYGLITDSKSGIDLLLRQLREQDKPLEGCPRGYHQKSL